MNIQQFEKWEGKTSDVILSRRIYVEMIGDFRAGMMLGEIVYWHLRSKKDGKIRLRVRKKHPKTGKSSYWLSKSGTEWFDALGLSRHESRAGLAKLETAGLIEIHTWRYDGHNTTHVRLLWSTFLKEFEKCAHKYGQGNQLDGSGNQLITEPAKALNTNLLNSGDSEESMTSISPADDQEVSPPDVKADTPPDAKADTQLLAAANGKLPADFDPADYLIPKGATVTGWCPVHDDILLDGEDCWDCEEEAIPERPTQEPPGWSTVAEIEEAAGE